jgi:hypothetical protein
MVDVEVADKSLGRRVMGRPERAATLTVTLTRIVR